MDGRYLFKAKRIDNGEWVQGSCVYTFAPSKGYVVGIMVESYFIVEENGNMVSIDKNTICQCTGLKDKNGKLIWENDVVKKHFYSIYDDCVNSEEYIGVVKLKDFAWVVDSFKGEYKCAIPIFEVMSYSEDVKHFEVIGNIFDNKELLEREE